MKNTKKIMALAVGILLVAATVIVAVHPTGAQAAPGIEELVQKAKETLALGKYAEAAQMYRKAYNEGATGADICYNTGTAYLRAGKLGLGVLFLERAAALSPDDKDVQANLTWARDNIRNTAATGKKTEEETADSDQGLTLTGLVGLLSLDTWAVLFVVGFWFLAGVLVLLLFSRREKRKTLALIAAGLFVWSGVFGGLFWLKNQQEAPGRYGVVMTRVEAKEGPNQGFDTVFDVPEGAKAELKDTIDDWSEIRLPNGLHGYIPSSQFERI